MRKPPSPINSHRLARLIVCAQAIVAWAAAAFFGDMIASRRRIRQRFGLLSLDKLALIVRNLMIARAGALFGKKQSRQWRDYAPCGFRRRKRARNVLRSIAGSRLRRFLREGDFASRLARMTHILRNLDAYVGAFLKRRAKRGINRIIAVLPQGPPHAAVRSLAAPAAVVADTS